MKSNKHPKDSTVLLAEEIFDRFLQQKNYRKTPERMVILFTIYKQTLPVDADTLLAELNLRHANVSKPTVYNTINLLVECDLVRQCRFGGSKMKYEKTLHNSKHYLVCTQCHTAKEFTNVYLKKNLPTTNFRGFRAAHHALHVYGICSKCAKKINTDKGK